MKLVGEAVLYLVGIFVIVPVFLILLIWVYSMNSIKETTKPEYLRQIGSRYTRYVDLDEVRHLQWATGLHTGCTYTRLSWSGRNKFTLSDTLDKRGRYGLQKDGEVWYPQSGKWDRGPIDNRKPSAYLSGQVSNCNTSKFGRIPNVYRKIFREDVWFIDTRISLTVISNKDKTIEYLSESN